MALFPKRRLVAPTMDSRLAAQSARVWLDECLATHGPCRSIKSVLPKRVIRLSSHSDPQLYISQPGQQADYIALSYCWGTNQPFVTISERLEVHMNGIPWDVIPHTLRDAMLLTLELGIQYIWIDALCIIQDDPADWAEEAPKMGEIYENALLTLSASASDSSQAGLFHSQRSPQYKLRHQLSTLGSMDIYARKICELTHHVHFEGRSPSSLSLAEEIRTRFPIVSRGWTFQEHILSRRVLHLGPEELAWECLERVQCECASKTARGIAAVRTKKRGVDDRLESLSSGRAELTMNHPLREWQDLVSNYSTRNFTKYSDRLVALESTARKFSRLDMGSYHYGVWAENVPLQLYWVAQKNTRRLDLPTWSWASVMSSSYYDPFPFFPETSIVSTCEVLGLPDCSRSPAAASRALVLSGLAVDAKIHFERRVWLKENSPLAVTVDIDNQRRKIAVDILQYSEGTVEWESMQAEERLFEGQCVVCFQVGVYNRSKEDGSSQARSWMVLRPSSDGFYTRVGGTWFEDDILEDMTVPAFQFFDDLAERRTVCII